MKYLSFLLSAYLLTSSPVFSGSTSKSLDPKIIDQKNKEGIFEFAKLASVDGQLLTEHWGFAAKAVYKNHGFDFVFISKQVSEEELDDILKKVEGFYDGPFELWIDENTNKDIDNILKKRGYDKRSSFEGDVMPIDRNISDVLPFDVRVEEITTNNAEQISDWATITATVHKVDKTQLEKLCKAALQKLPSCHFYVAYYQDKPVASNLLIVYEDMVTAYFESTLPEYKTRGIASILLKRVLKKLGHEKVRILVSQNLIGDSNRWKKVGIKPYGNTYTCYRKISSKK